MFSSYGTGVVVRKSVYAKAGVVLCVCVCVFVIACYRAFVVCVGQGGIVLSRAVLSS